MVLEPDLGDELDRRHLPTTTLAGWRQFVTAEPVSLNLLAWAVYDALDPARRGFGKAAILIDRAERT
jgi:hypothetical protein